MKKLEIKHQVDFNLKGDDKNELHWSMYFPEIGWKIIKMSGFPSEETATEFGNFLLEKIKPTE